MAPLTVAGAPTRQLEVVHDARPIRPDIAPAAREEAPMAWHPGGARRARPGRRRWLRTRPGPRRSSSAG